MADQPGSLQGPQGGPPQRNFFLRHKILSAVLAFLLLFVVIGIVNGGSKSATTVATPTTAAAPPTNAQAPAPTTGVAPAQLMCSDVAGVFVPHGTDGRGDCEPRPTPGLAATCRPRRRTPTTWPS